MAKVDIEYVDPIRFIFHTSNIMLGAMGGRPDQALFFVGLQENELIFLDPHLVQDSATHDELMYGEWVDAKDDMEERTMKIIDKVKEEDNQHSLGKLRK